MGVNEILNVGNRIKQCRIKAGYTQKEMADRLGIPKSTYSNYENGHREPKKEILEKLAKELNMNIHDLLGTAEELHNIMSQMEKLKQKGDYFSNLITTISPEAEKRDVIFDAHLTYLCLLYEYLGIVTFESMDYNTLQRILVSSELKSFFEYLMSKYSNVSMEGN